MAINELQLPDDIQPGGDFTIIIPVENENQYRQLSQIAIQIRDPKGSIEENLVIRKKKGSPRELETSGESIFNLSGARYDPQDRQMVLQLTAPRTLPPGDLTITGKLRTSLLGEIGMMPAFRKVGGEAPEPVVVHEEEDDEIFNYGRKVHRVSLSEPERIPTEDQKLWVYIRNGTLDFNRYQKFITDVMTDKLPDGSRGVQRGRSLLFRTDAYDFLKQATDFFMTRHFVHDPDDLVDNRYDESRVPASLVAEEQRRTRRTDDLTVSPSQPILPYFQQVLRRLGDQTFLNDHENAPFRVPNLTLLELLWSYWEEEGGLVQTMNAISLRFQNVRAGNGHDPLAGLNIDPLRPLNNLIWGFIQDERFRLSMAQRNFEYQYEYGLSLIGRAVPNMQAAESRTQFIPAFHNLLKTAMDFYQQANYTTVIPDGFPILNHLREVHLLLAEGAHNSFRDLPYTARAEMLMQQWILGRPEMREFLGGRVMMPYTEDWMERVDAMKALQGWNPTNVTHFHSLAQFGEQLLLSIRYGNWNDTAATALSAANWAHYWREEIQRYVHAYKAVTGVDLGADITDARIALPQNAERYQLPGVLINQRLGLLPPGRQPGLQPGFQPGLNLLSRSHVRRELPGE